MVFESSNYLKECDWHKAGAPSAPRPSGQCLGVKFLPQYCSVRHFSFHLRLGFFKSGFSKSSLDSGSQFPDIILIPDQDPDFKSINIKQYSLSKIHNLMVIATKQNESRLEFNILIKTTLNISFIGLRALKIIMKNPDFLIFSRNFPIPDQDFSGSGIRISESGSGFEKP